MTKLTTGLIRDYRTGQWLADLSNFSAIVFDNMDSINWVGFYLDTGRRLELGPFKGRPACTHIDYSRGVCGKAFRDREILIVDDVYKFDGHISCDPESKSEMVLPILIEKDCVGVLDIDSPIKGRFQEIDKSLLTACLGVLVEGIDRSTWSKRPWR